MGQAVIRLPDWPERLDVFMRAARERPFSWGSWDCGHFVCDAALAITGVDPGAPWRGLYDGPVAAKRMLVDQGFDGAAAWADHVIGRRIGLAYARRGDWVLGTSDDDLAFGVIVGAQAVFLQPKGLTFRATLRSVAAWPIGD